jgi:membrane protein DedA with SNARE-associated domain
VGQYAERVGTFVFLPASIILFLAGAAMVLQAWNFGQLWVAASVALWIGSALAGALYLGPTAKKVGKLFETEGPDSTKGRTLLSRVFLVSRLELLSFAVVIALMVFKPGAP